MQTESTSDSSQDTKRKNLDFILFTIVAFLLVVIIILLGILFTTRKSNKNDVQSDLETKTNTETPLDNKLEEPTSKMPAFYQSDKVELTNLIEGQTLSSPFIITGNAKLFFSEGEFMVEVYNMSDTLIGNGIAIAQSENWMSEEFTNFSAEINFNNGQETSGKIVFVRANPSGLSENDERYSINVNFESQNIVIDDIASILSMPLRDSMPITGMAKGFYFEGEFPVELLSPNGEIIATGSAIAQSDWMTTDFVPFNLELIFENPENTQTATLRFKKSNPSDLSSQDEKLDIKIIF